MSFLNRYLDAMVHIILSYRGTIIEILGDGLLVIFGAPIQQTDDSERAVACALSMQLQMEGVNALLRQEGLPEIEMGIGIHTGDVVVGNIGSQQRTKYGVVGSAVNLTGRIESYTTGSQVLISPSTYQEAAPLLEIRQEMTVEPKGVDAPITIYEASGLGGKHQLFLPDANEVLVPLHEAIAVRYSVLEGKFAGDTVFTGRLVKLAKKAAELHTDHPVDVFSNLKMQLVREHGDGGLGDLFAKVLEVPTESPSRVVIGFTSISDEAKAIFDPVMRYEYNKINRSVQGLPIDETMA
jgi:adenylate cyclase